MAGKKQKRQLRWSRERIRAELSRLDDITGLKGANVTVRLYEEREPLGLFTFIDPVRMTFGFSSPGLRIPNSHRPKRWTSSDTNTPTTWNMLCSAKALITAPTGRSAAGRSAHGPRPFTQASGLNWPGDWKSAGLSAPGWTASHRVNRSLTPPSAWALWRRWNDIRL